MSKSKSNSTPKRPKRQILRTANGRKVGIIDGCQLIKRANGNKHMLQKPRGWAFDREVLVIAREMGVTTVKVIDRANHKTYVAPLALFFSDGEPVDRGHGVQKVLPLEYWQVTLNKPSRTQNGNLS